MMLATFKKIMVLLALEGRSRLYWLVAAVVLMAFLDMVGVASIFPFLNVISDPAVIQQNEKLRWAYETFAFKSTDAFLISLGMLSFVILIMNNALRAAISVALIRFSHYKRYVLSKALAEKYLYEPYAFFLNRNTSELTTYLVSEIARVVTGVLIPCLQVFARATMALCIVGLLIVIDPFVALIIIGIIGAGYAGVFAFVKKMLGVVGEGLTEFSKKIYKALHEAFGGIKDIKISGKESAFIDNFAGSVKAISECYCRQFMIFQLPRYAFEILVFGGILFAAIYVAVIQGQYATVVPIVGLYAFAAYRLMPTLQQIYQDVSYMRSSLPALDAVYADFAACTGTAQREPVSVEQRLTFTKDIRFHDITYRYPNAEQAVLDHFDLTIEAKTTIGLVGGSGAGKTTLIDVLMGLLRPEHGELVADGQKISDANLRRWQANIGYVPQSIYLCDDTVTRNIAFGVRDVDIDHAAVEAAAKMANIHDFVTKEMPEGYETMVGDRGVRLSGGQRQRIGIARALYHDPSLLVFDEATSALDGITEDAILEAIYNLAHKKTIILIAHRLSTVKECDVIHVLERGKLAGKGTYKELMMSNRQFREMAKVGE